MNENVENKTRELAMALVCSPEYIAMRLAQDEMEEDPGLEELFIEYSEKKQRLEDLMEQDGADPDEVRAASEAFEKAQKEIRSNPYSLRYQKAAKSFSALMKEVNLQLKKALDPESAEEQDCTGDCASCPGKCGQI